MCQALSEPEPGSGVTVLARMRKIAGGKPVRVA